MFNPRMTRAQVATVADMISSGRTIYSMSTHQWSGALTVKGPADGQPSSRVETLAVIEPGGATTYRSVSGARYAAELAERAEPETGDYRPLPRTCRHGAPTPSACVRCRIGSRA